MRGDLKVFYGPMFAGKTSRMIEEVKKYDSFSAVKPNLDDRYSEIDIVSHNGLKIPANSVPVDEVYDLVKGFDYDELSVVGFDEAQFFEEEVCDAVDYVLEKGVDVVVAGLDTDFRKEPFGSMPELKEMSDYFEKLYAECEVCGDDAGYTQRILDGEPAAYDDPVVVIGAEESYEPRCDDHHIIGKADEYDERVLERA